MNPPRIIPLAEWIGNDENLVLPPIVANAIRRLQAADVAKAKLKVNQPPPPLSAAQVAALMAVSTPAGDILGMPVRIIPKECLPPGAGGIFFDSAGQSVTIKAENVT